ncbi:dienelactone hydrolase family protein [Paenibacillus puerhi]|uniref:dienelactone hydrolase family protein n=1 Tax=Paenibacillus puerhi TaxID=2692622 RepID=UPI0013576257|nr:alpha/beta hydrolase family protein [Paenibacillus puerhi]
MWNPDEFVEHLYTTETQELAFQRAGADNWAAWRNQLTEKFTASLGGLNDRSSGLQPRLLERTEHGDYICERIELTTAPSLRMPLHLLIPKGRAEHEKLPVVVGCHGHGYGSKAALGLGADGKELGDVFSDHKKFAISLVKRGFAVIVPELLGFGERKLKDEIIVNSHTNSCFSIGVFLLTLGKTMAGMRIQETMAAIDYVSTRPEVDAERIGIMGLSGGGLVASFTSALDQRIKATVVCCYTNTFRDSILHSRHCIDNYIPGILRYAEMPDLIGLIAPRPLFVEAGHDDPLFPVHGTEKAIATLSCIYRAADAGKNLDFHIFPGVHEVWGERAYPWLERQLKA